jgi:hypothetical protein
VLCLGCVTGKPDSICWDDALPPDVEQDAIMLGLALEACRAYQNHISTRVAPKVANSCNREGKMLQSRATFAHKHGHNEPFSGHMAQYKSGSSNPYTTHDVAQTPAAAGLLKFVREYTG